MTQRLIKKYGNRRLYDTERGEYITLRDVKKLVLDHIEFKVVDAKTGKDLTQNTLLQIIAEEETESASPLFTTTVLQEFIRSYQQNSQQLFSQYLEQTLDFFVQQRQIFEQLLPGPELIKQFFQFPFEVRKSTKRSDNPVDDKKNPNKSNSS